MTDSTSGRTPPARRLNGQVRPKQNARALSHENKLWQDRGNRTQQISAELAVLLAEPETRLIMEADNVGLEELVAALTRIPIPHRRRQKH
jgi:hypothetical protein